MDRDRALEQIKARTFVGQNAAFLGCLLCNLTFTWDENVETACVSEKTFRWNPTWFDKLTQDERQFVLLHELWHIALLHSARGLNKDHERWNSACDYRINANLINDGYQMPEGGLYNKKYQDPEVTEEKIYAGLPEDKKPPKSQWGTKIVPNQNDANAQVMMVNSALLSARNYGVETGRIHDLVSEFLKPKLSWKQMLRRYLIEKLDPEWSMARPNRRFSHMYLPSLLPAEGQITSVVMFLDTSGSIEDEDVQRFMTEAKFIQDNLQPEKLTLVQFDTRIKHIDKYDRGDRIKEIYAYGRGGTNYDDIFQYINDKKPTLSLIFTDLYAPESEVKLKTKNLAWLVYNSKEPNPYPGETFYV